MPVTDVTHDLDTRTLTITAEFAAPIERIWQVYADPRQLEQVFGPPTYPATFVEHDLTPGGRAHYFMTSPEGEKYYGWWKVTAVDEPRSFAFEDGFAADDSFTPLEDLPVSTERVRVRGDRRRHPGHVHQHLRLRRSPAAGARHGRGRGRVLGDRPDRRPRRRLTRSGRRDAFRRPRQSKVSEDRGRQRREEHT